MSWRKITFVLIALFVLLGGAAALSWLFVSMKPEPPRRPDNELKRSVKTITVEYRDLPSTVVATGRVISGNEVLLVAEAAGKIESGQVNLKKGASFSKGQLLARIYKDEAELALKARESGFLNLLTNILPDLKVDFPTEYPQYLKFFNAIDMNGDLPELPAIVNEKLKIFLSSRSLLSEYYSIRQDEKRLSRYSLYAPFSGTFVQVNVEPGAYVNAGSQIAKMVNTGHIEIEVPVKNGQSKFVKIGDRVAIHSSLQDEPMTGKVVRKANFVDMNTQARSIFVQVGGTNRGELLPGEYMEVEFFGQEIPNAVEIARSAVFNSNEVFAVIDGKLKKQEIEIVKMNETSLFFRGLEPGTKVVSEPLINVQENTSVNVLGEEPKEEGMRGKKQGNNNKAGGKE